MVVGCASELTDKVDYDASPPKEAKNPGPQISADVWVRPAEGVPRRSTVRLFCAAAVLNATFEVVHPAPAPAVYNRGPLPPWAQVTHCARSRHGWFHTTRVARGMRSGLKVGSEA